MLGIEDYPTMVRVCCMTYACGIVLLVYLRYVFGHDTQPGLVENLSM